MLKAKNKETAAIPDNDKEISTQETEAEGRMEEQSDLETLTCDFAGKRGIQKMGKKRRSIALLVAGFENTFVRQLCTGAMTAAAETDSNLVVFPGHFINPPHYDKHLTQYE